MSWHRFWLMALSEYDIPYDEEEQCVMVILPYESEKCL